MLILPLANVSEGGEDKIATSSNGKWEPEVCWPPSVFPIRCGARRFGGAVRRFDTAHGTLHSVSNYHFRSVRIRVEVGWLMTCEAGELACTVWSLQLPFINAALALRF